MKKIKNIKLTATLVCFAFFLIGCENADLNIQDNPNALTAESADPNFILNSIQVNFTNQHFSLSNSALDIMRNTNMFGTYASNATNGEINGPWATTYQMFSDLKLLEEISVTRNLPVHVGMGQVLKAFAMVNMVDYIGDAVYSQALNPAEFPNPEFDEGKTIYDAMYLLLDEAIGNLNTAGSINPEDLYFNGDVSKWVKLANSLKIKMYVTSKLSGTANAAAKINQIVASGKYMTNMSDDFYSKFGTSETNPDTRHPFWSGNYLAAAGSIQSNDFMNKMLNGRSFKDPRMNQYFYRQVLVDPNDPLIVATGNVLLPCDGDASFTFCYIGEGYWGRDHGDDEGIPNHGQQLATFGAYPVGGAIDLSGTQGDAVAVAAASYNSATSSKTQGEHIFDELTNVNPAAKDATTSGGAGIHPIMMSSFNDFLLAEASLPIPQGMGVTGSSSTYLRNALTKSFATVASHTGVAMNATDVTAYINEVLALHDAATTEIKLQIIMREYYIAAFMNGVEAYNGYRRTGYPVFTTGQTVGSFPRSFLFPISELEANDNPNVIQKTSTAVQVFWDTNAPGFID